MAKSPFDVWIEAEELPRIREVIRAWGKPPNVAEAYGGARLHDHLERWCQFFETDWERWDISEYDHDIGCRVLVQLVIETRVEPAITLTGLDPLSHWFRTWFEHTRSL